MPNYTKNLGLTKPLPEEFYDVNVRNENWDKIDEAIQKNTENFHRGQTVFPSSIEIHPEAGADHGGYIDFHFEGSEDDFTSRIIEEERGIIGVKGAFAMNDTIGQGSRKGYFLQWYGHTHLRNYSDDNNFSEIILKPDDITPSVVQNKDGVAVEHQIYHTGNLDLSKIGSAGLTPASIE